MIYTLCAAMLLAAVPAAADWAGPTAPVLNSLAKAPSEVTEFARVPLSELERARPLAVRKLTLGGVEYSLTLVFDYRKDTYVEIYPSARPELAQNWHVDRVIEGVVYEKAGVRLTLSVDDVQVHLAADGEKLDLDLVEFITAVHDGARRIYFDWVPYGLLRNTDPLSGQKSVVLMRLGKNGNYYTFAGYDSTLTGGWAQWFLPIKEKFYGMTLKDGAAVFLTKPFHIDTGDDDSPLPAPAGRR